ncbi:M20 family metallopeptidase [Gulosibacter sp. 10]|uniref:M20 metallopeptidase family protein n=1 Tax=Gulosibacter sp. 10 TaxID=1255570 RepID=UPI00097EBE77|nr:M20 family metallopeptidase [Gulosibacter sp. 10]SJM60352.1 N-acyl-L-amino acid amidohydrolase [Gulosibacter sp. 10]
MNHDSPADLIDDWRSALREELPFALELRRALHRDPRVSGREGDTRDAIIEAAGIDMAPVAETGAIGRVGPPHGPSIGIRAELDALPVHEKTGIDWASANGAMHACGHDVHLAALTAVVRAAARIELPYGLVPILQPREEAYPSGALDISRSGALDEFEVAHVIGAHVHPNVTPGSVATGGGFVNAAAGEIEISVAGRGGHGAYPHHASDVISTLASIALAIPEVLRRTVDPLVPALVSVGTLEAGNGAANVLADRGRILATVRTTRAGDARTIVDAVERMARGQAESFGTFATTSYVEGEPTLSNDRELSRVIDGLLPEAGLSASEPMRSLGADDFSYFSDARPSVMCFVGVESRGPGGRHSLHDAEFLPDEGAVERVAHTLVVGYAAAASRLAKAPRRHPA